MESLFFAFLQISLSLPSLRARQQDAWAAKSGHIGAWIVGAQEHLTNAYRRLATVVSDETVSPRNRIEAEKAGCEVAVAIVKLQFEEAIILRYVCAQISYW